MKTPFRAMRNTDYAGNFEDFLESTEADQPFCFWSDIGSIVVEPGIGKRSGKDPDQVVVPPFFLTMILSETTFSTTSRKPRPSINKWHGLSRLRSEGNWTTRSSLSPATTACRFRGPRRVSMTQAHACHWQCAGRSGWLSHETAVSPTWFDLRSRRNRSPYGSAQFRWDL